MTALTLLVLLLIYLSVRERARRRMTRCKELGGLDTRSSPLANALGALVGTAGGIYLSMVMLINFLELDVPNKVQIMGVNMEPLAAISLLMAIVQPFAMRLIGR